MEARVNQRAPKGIFVAVGLMEVEEEADEEGAEEEVEQVEKEVAATDDQAEEGGPET